MRDDLVAVLLEDGLVGERDLVEALGLEAAEAFGDQRVQRALLVGEGGLDDRGGLLLEVVGADALEADQQAGDRMVGARDGSGEGRVELAALAEVVLLQDIEARGAAEAADQRSEGAGANSRWKAACMPARCL